MIPHYTHSHGRSRALSVSVIFFVLAASLFALFSLGVSLFVPYHALADSAFLDPDGDGTVAGTQTTCGGAGEYDCLNDAVRDPTAPSTIGDYVTWGVGVQSYYQMQTAANVDTVTEVKVHVHHVEGGAGMRLAVSLWDAAETTEYGTEATLPAITAAAWASTTFSVSLTQAQLDGMRVRLRCFKASGPNSTCRAHATYATITYTLVQNVTVSSRGTQATPVNIPATNQELTAQFVITENTDTRSVTGITITENGTVNAATNLDNIKLYYDLDTSAPYDCASESYAGGDPQFGVTDTDGFSGADGTSAFSGTSVTISTTQTMCVYVMLDVLATAIDQETLEIEIVNPSTDVTISAGTIGPVTQVLFPGTTTLADDILTQIRSHWRNDNNTEALATSATGAVEDTMLTLAQESRKRLRIEVSNEGNASSPSTQYRLEYGLKDTTCGAIASWIDVGAAGGDWDMSDSPNLTDGDDTTNVAAANGGVTNENITFLTPNAAVKDTSSQTAGIILTSTEYVELEYSIIASTTATEGNRYCFRVTDAGAEIKTYTRYPEATIAADVTVSSRGTQATPVNIPATNQELTAQFVITENTDTRSVTGITITENGTVNAATNLDNIKLYYDLDTSAPYDCASESYAGGDPQFGVTDTDGFSGADGTSAFSGTSVTISTTQTMCVYVMLDVLATANDQETIEIKIDTPSSEVVVSAGSVAPTSAVLLSGATTLEKVILTQIRSHWRNDDNTEALATSATGAVEDTTLTDLQKNTRRRLRIEVSNEGGATSASTQYRLEYGKKVTTCVNIASWTDVGAVGGDWDMSDSPNLTDGNNTTDVVAANGGVTNENTTFLTPNAAVKDTSSQTAGITLTGTEFVELEYSIIALDAATAGATYCLRVTNAGTEIDAYTRYPEVMLRGETDFFIQRGVFTMTGTTQTITAGAEYVAPSASSSAFVRITNTQLTGGGNSGGGGNANADDITVYVQDASNILTSITFARFGAAGDTRVAWEIVEYTGAAGGDNEMIVRGQGTVTFTTTGLAASTTVSGVVDNTDVAVFITGAGNPDVGRTDWNTVLATAAWASASTEAVFTRGEASADAIVVSFAVVEYVGSNWKVQRAEHTYSAADAEETETITAVNNLERAFLHVQKRAGAGLQGHDEFGHEVWLSGVAAVSFFLEAGATTPSGQTSVAWVIENTQTNGTPMVVTRSNGSQSGGVSPVTVNVSIGKTLDNLNIASIFTNNRSSGTGNTYPEPIMAVRLISTTQYELWVSDAADTRTYRTEVVEWPTAVRTFTQNYYRFYVDNDLLDPTDPWPPGGINLGENTAITSADSPPQTGDRVRIRMSLLVGNAKMIAGADNFKLQYGTLQTTCTAIVNWYSTGEVGSTTAPWRGYNGTQVDGTALSGNPPTGGDLNLSVSDRAGSYEEENNSAFNPFNVFPGEDIEYDWLLEQNGAVEQTTYCFRMIEADNDELLGSNFYPTITVQGYTPESQNWQWFNDENNETPTDALAAETVAPSAIEGGNVLKLRLTINEVNGIAGIDQKFQLQFSTYSDFSADVNEVVATSSCTLSSLWCYGNGVDDDDDGIISRVLSDSTANGTHNEAATTTSTFDPAASTATEFEFTLLRSGAASSTTYFFRAWDVNDDRAVALATGESLPSLSTAGGSLEFTISGISSGTMIEGTTTNITTTSIAIPFDALVVGEKKIAAQRLLVTTDASEGYQVLLKTNGQLLSTYGEAIPDVTGTNAAPTSWASGCNIAATGCWGYHSGDDVLALGSTRFTLNDTFARFATTTSDEVAYNSSPVTDETTDMVYLTEIQQLQPAGTYTVQLQYIVVPIF